MNPISVKTEQHQHQSNSIMEQNLSSMEPQKRQRVSGGDDSHNLDTVLNNNPVTIPFSVVLADPTVFDCSACHKTLTIPLYQCRNGHLTCSTCYKPKCPCCSEKKPGLFRNIVLERTLKSIKICCPNKIHGCEKSISYCDKTSHEKACVYAPYPCPYTSCTFLGPPIGLSLHLKRQHPTCLLPLSLDKICRFSVSSDAKFIIFIGEEDDGPIFLLNIDSDKMEIGCIQDPKKGVVNRYDYTLTMKDKCSSLVFKSVTYPWRSDYLAIWHRPFVRSNFVKGFSYFLGQHGLITLELCLYGKVPAASVEVTRVIAETGSKLE